MIEPEPRGEGPLPAGSPTGGQAASSLTKAVPTKSPGPGDPIWDRLEDQISWYDRKSANAQRWFKRLKLAELIIAAAVPAIAAAKGPPALLTVLGALVVVLEGSQHLYQFQEHWITYRSTCEALRHERFLFLAEAGPYARARSRRAMLAERIEGLVSREQAKWTASQEEFAHREADDRD